MRTLNKFLKKFIFIIILIFFLSITIGGVKATTWTVCTVDYGSCNFTSIQTAIDSLNVAEGDKLNVTGTFFENVTVGKSLTITSNDTLESNLSGFFLLITPIGNVKISHFNITGARQCNLEEAAICDNTGKSRNNVYEFLNISGPGAGIEINGATTTPVSRNITIRNNRIVGRDKGISLGKPPNDATNGSLIINNQFIGIKDYAIVIYKGTEHNISNNYFEGSENISSGGVATFANSVSAVIEHNNFTKFKSENSTNHFVILVTSSIPTDNVTIFDARIFGNSCVSTNDQLMWLGFQTNLLNSSIFNNTACGDIVDFRAGNISGNFFYDNEGYTITLRRPTIDEVVANVSENIIFNSTKAAIQYVGAPFAGSLEKIIARNYISDIRDPNGAIYLNGPKEGPLTITKNNLTNNFLGIGIVTMTGAQIYNNYFANTWNARAPTLNNWNITKTAGGNIIGGPFIAGNFWSDYTGNDIDSDSIGDTQTPYNSGGNITIGGDFAPLVVDVVPPATVTNLRDTANGTMWILWNWTNPPDPDFNHVEIYIDGFFRENTSNTFYNATNLNLNTSYTIQIRTVDNLGNVNITWVNDTAFTQADVTPPAIIFVSPTPDNISINKNFSFINVTLGDNVTLAILQWNNINETMFGSGTNWFQNKTSLVDGNYSFKVYANDTFGNTGISKERYVVIDTIPPASVTNLAETAVGGRWILWNWINPSDSDFNHAEIWINNSFRANVSTNSYNATNLNDNTVYEIQTRTVDNAGNINLTWVNDTARTFDITPPADITNLNETSFTSTRINWAWTNPTDPDFSHIEIYLDGAFKVNTTLNYYEAIGLTQNTTYELEVRPVDNVTNIGNWTNDTAKTKCRGPCFPPH